MVRAISGDVAFYGGQPPSSWRDDLKEVLNLMQPLIDALSNHKHISDADLAKLRSALGTILDNLPPNTPEDAKTDLSMAFDFIDTCRELNDMVDDKARSHLDQAILLALGRAKYEIQQAINIPDGTKPSPPHTDPNIHDILVYIDKLQPPLNESNLNWIGGQLQRVELELPSPSQEKDDVLSAMTFIDIAKCVIHDTEAGDQKDLIYNLVVDASHYLENYR